MSNVTSMGTETVEQKLARLEAENERLRAKSNQPLSFKIGDKGGLSVYGLNSRFPTTLYKQQWEKLLSAENVGKIMAFIAANGHKLATKD